MTQSVQVVKAWPAGRGEHYHPHGPAKLDAPLVRYEILDEERVRAALGGEYLPQSGLFRCWLDRTSPFTVQIDGIDAINAEAADRGQPAARDMSLAMHELVVSTVGVDPTNDLTDEWIDEGQAAMRAMLIERPKTSLDRLIGADEARLRDAEAVGRQFLLPPSAIESVTGRPYVARRSLLTPGTQAVRLSAAKREREAIETKVRAAEQAAAIELARPKSLRELGYQCIAVDKDRIGTSLEPFTTAAPQAEDEARVFYFLREFPGLRLPHFDQHGVRLLGDDFIVPALASPVHDSPSFTTVTFCRQMRRRFARHLDFGPVTEWSDAGMDLAIALIEKYAERLIYAPPALLWQQDHLIGLLTRGLRKHPTWVAGRVCEKLDAIHRARHADFAVPSPFAAQERALAQSQRSGVNGWARPDNARVMRSPPGAEALPSQGMARVIVGDLAVAATAGGDVGVGELLDEEPKTKKTKGARS